ncbi:tetratricopeptide repeat protein [Azospirillum endophyticum]|uniref:O-linked N-acetylglucosamine transferase, SPINDLY family protein n=1 Tax=Azospirillum endophyticum TaxID=2800326 RepID=UPI001FFF97AD|nr:tetratricopeptide repeat protein [Azospirillum endophyticum]
MTLNEAMRLALGHFHAGRMAEAEELCRAILQAVPGTGEVAQLLGVAVMMQGRPQEAEAILRQSIAMRPELADSHGNLGTVLQSLGRVGEALAAHDRCAQLSPATPEAYVNRGSARLALGDRNGAATDFARALRLRPVDALAATNLGVALRESHRVAEAERALRRALAVEPGHAEAMLGYAHALRELGRLGQAKIAYTRAVALTPAKTEALCYHLYLMQTLCDWDDYDRLCARVRETIDRDGGVVIPLATLSIETTPAQQDRSARLFYDRLVKRPSAPPMPARVTPRPDGRLRIAYVSADFHEHATAYLAAELFELHDRDRFEVLAYSYGPDDGSAMRQRLVKAFDRFRDIRSVPLDAVARRMADDGVDIMVDLKGYTKQTRLDLLSRRLAPVEVSYLGYPGTIGCPHMDYVIGDRFVTPPEHQPFYAERLAILPDAYQINDRHRPLPDAVPSRADCGLPEDGVVFAAFNTAYKISPAMFALWMRVLKRVPGSVLWLFEANPLAAGNLKAAAEARGVDPARLVFAPPRPLAEHIARYRVADLALDTLPYTGHTTTSDALWAGCPTPPPATRCGRAARW